MLSANEDNRVNDSSGSDSEVEERGGVIKQDDSFGISDSEGVDSIKRNFHGGSHDPLIVASLECLELLLWYKKRSTIAHDRGKVYFLTNSKIIDIYIEEFRINLNISTTQLQQKLQMRNINMEELKTISVAAYDDLKISQSCMWSRAFFTEYSSSDAFENNLGEPFNAAIRIARTKPICYAHPLKPVNGMNMWKVITNVRINPPLFKKPPVRPPARHNKMYCKKHPFSKPPKNRPGRPHKEVITHVSPCLFIHAPEGTPGSRRTWFASASQPEHDVPSLSTGLPKRGPGRPRKKLSEGVYIIAFCSIIINV
ncbi:hypothetical protein HID58_018665 [Brassica napus]|uniref:Uncharacterized protein n=1 Tax=Brassica napus TaxID=3708 RepID=A0ABQ8DAM1_BRANA|nr:hypothetical protein HID58_018665 [Brassica napus]